MSNNRRVAAMANTAIFASNNYEDDYEEEIPAKKTRRTVKGKKVNNTIKRKTNNDVKNDSSVKRRKNAPSTTTSSTGDESTKLKAKILIKEPDPDSVQGPLQKFIPKNLDINNILKAFHVMKTKVPLSIYENQLEKMQESNQKMENVKNEFQKLFINHFDASFGLSLSEERTTITSPKRNEMLRLSTKKSKTRISTPENRIGNLQVKKEKEAANRCQSKKDIEALVKSGKIVIQDPNQSNKIRRPIDTKPVEQKQPYGWNRPNYIDRSESIDFKKRVFVRGKNLQKSSLEEAFSKFGVITKIYVGALYSNQNNFQNNMRPEDEMMKSIITFKEVDSCARAVSEMNNQIIDGKKIFVSFHKRRPNDNNDYRSSFNNRRSFQRSRGGYQNQQNHRFQRYQSNDYHYQSNEQQEYKNFHHSTSHYDNRKYHKFEEHVKEPSTIDNSMPMAPMMNVVPQTTTDNVPMENERLKEMGKEGNWEEVREQKKMNIEKWQSEWNKKHRQQSSSPMNNNEEKNKERNFSTSSNENESKMTSTQQDFHSSSESLNSRQLTSTNDRDVSMEEGAIPDTNQHEPIDEEMKRKVDDDDDDEDEVDENEFDNEW
ncbi:hypothetical protein SNEBB_008094 [Seison nebaliae]|nr:hypothetical protein SNEBB_008094 [Seison nebaliae]